MILRRFMKHVTDQNWFAVGLDVIVVIVGIFLGLQVQEWNEQRQEIGRESEYLERLLLDIDSSISRTLFGQDLLNRQVSYADTMLKSLESCELSDEDAEIFANGLYLLGKYDPPLMVRGAIDDLLATGNFKVIQNRELREKLTNTLAFIDVEQSLNVKITDRILPALQYLDQKSTFRIKEVVMGIEEVDTSKVNFDFPVLCQDKKFTQSISLVEAYVYALIFVNDTAVQSFREIKSLIEAELERFE